MASARATVGDNDGSPLEHSSRDGSSLSWSAVLDAAIPAVVALQVTAVRSFQDDHAGAHGGTGFVVDAERGLVLTNRHVCTCGPARAAATFVGASAMEELPIEIAYVDPTHDFAILRFDPGRLRQTPHAEIRLDPQGCKVGAEVRIIGNDSLEKLQILSGTIARVDRNPPELPGDYQDENTFYALAASGCRGGSSGSPVVDHRGFAVALNAAARTGTMHALFLPLHRVALALDAVRAGIAVPRGTLCAAFVHASLPECARLGVDEAFMQEKVLVASQGGTFGSQPPSGMLKVKHCIPGTPAAAALQPGDVLLELDEKPCADFVFLEQALDDAVGQSVRLLICRGDSRLTFEIPVRNLHSLVPRAFVEFGFGVFHEVSYQSAQKHHIPLKGIYVAQAGFIFGEAVKSDSVVLEVNGIPCTDLQTFVGAVQGVSDKERFSVQWILPSNMQDRRKREGLAKLNKRWTVFRSWTQDLVSRSWTPQRVPFQTKMLPPAAPDRSEEQTSTINSQDSGKVVRARRVSAGGAAPPRKKARRSSQGGSAGAHVGIICVVRFRTMLNFDTDLVVDEQEDEADSICRLGAGIIIDAEAGLVLTDRVTVPQPLGDIEVTLGEHSHEASVLFVHPTHSLVVLRLDRDKNCGGADVRGFGRSAKFEDRTLDDGDELSFVGVDSCGKSIAARVKVQAIRLCEFPGHSPPRWREKNLEAVFLAEDPPNAASGALCGEEGQILALYTTSLVSDGDGSKRIGYGIPTHAMLPLLEKPNVEPGVSYCEVPSLEVELRCVELQQLRRLPLRFRPSASWLGSLAELGASALQIAGVTAGGPMDGVASEGDLLVAVNGETLATAEALYEKLREAVGEADTGEGGRGIPRVSVTLLARGKEREVDVKVDLLGSDGAPAVLCWHGLVLQDTPRTVRECFRAPASVLISRTMLGSPAEADGIEGDFLLSVDGAPTPSLDAILALENKRPELGVPTPARAVPERRFLRVETADISGRRFTAMLEPNQLFWPAMMVARRQDGEWACMERS